MPAGVGNSFKLPHVKDLTVKDSEERQLLKPKIIREDDIPHIPESLAPIQSDLPMEPYPERLLPDTSMHIGERAYIPLLKSQCDRKQGKTVFDRYESTWLLFTSKDIDIRDHIDFENVRQGTRKDPVCQSQQASPVLALDHLPGVMVRQEVTMHPEIKLTDTFKSLDGQSSTVDIVKAQILDTLQKNSTSWVAYHLASLYWRIEGKADNAIDCLRMALSFVPHAYRDVPLIGLANVLQNIGYTNDAVVVTNAALYISSDVIESLYTMANIYANKSEWEKTVYFLQTILAKLPGFLHAEYKLKEIYCNELSSSSSVFYV